jgi:NADH dehydrogenase [ubiquinone] 1 alpha subcomplex assembly factor 1
MQNTTIILGLIMTMQTVTIFDFDSKSDLSQWKIIDDIVMGGRSVGTFDANAEGHGVFKGKVSLENNGGFSSLHYRCKKMATRNFTKIVLRVKGDGKSYQFRIKDTMDHPYSYVAKFDTAGGWETIEIPLSNMYPAFRGRRLEIPNYQSTTIEEVAFLIGNKKEEHFQLIIDRIELH